MGNKKKIVIVTDAWRPQKNGVVVYCEKMEELLSAEGHEVVVIHPQRFPIRTRLFFYPEIEIALVTKRAVGRILKEAGSDRVHIVTEGPLGLIARQYCVRHGIKFTTSYHTHYPLYVKARIKPLFRVAYNYIKWFHRKAVRTMVSTDTLRQHLEDEGFQNLVLAPLGVNVEMFKKNPDAPIPDELVGLPRPFFVYFGRVAVEKNVEAFLKCDLPGSKIVIGGGPQLNALEKKYGSRVTFFHKKGYAKNKAFVDLLSVMDVFVFPSKTETFGLVTLEALACELPVAAYDVMGARDIIAHGVHGFVGDDLERVALQCLSLTRGNLRDRALAFSWDAAAQAFVENLVEN